MKWKPKIYLHVVAFALVIFSLLIDPFDPLEPQYRGKITGLITLVYFSTVLFGETFIYIYRRIRLQSKPGQSNDVFTSGDDGFINPELNEDFYKADFELLDRYQTFSAEILRLSLAGFAAIGFLLALGDKAASTQRMQLLLQNSFARWSLILAVVFFGAASSVALAHRGFSSDSMHFHLRLLRGSKRKRDEIMRDRLLYLSEASMIAAPTFLALGVTCLGIAFLVLLH